MNRKAALLFLIPLFLVCELSPAAGAPVIAFGYLHNKSGNGNYDYLEVIFPNSFASTIQPFLAAEVRKPLQVEEILKKRGCTLKKHYDRGELSGLAAMIGADVFISGGFTPLPRNRLEIELSLYNHRSGELLTFTNTGKMETEIFRLVDRIALIVVNFLGRESLYKTRRIMPGSGIAVLTDLDAREMNLLHHTFIKKGYRLAALQVGDLRTVVCPAVTGHFRFIQTPLCSYWNMREGRETGALPPMCAGEAVRLDGLYDRHGGNHPAVEGAALERLHGSLGRGYDFLLVIGFSGNRKSCWLRAIDMKGKELVWIQSGMRAPSLTGVPVVDMGSRIAESMASEAANPLEKGSPPP